MLLSCSGHDEKSSPAPKCEGLDQSLTWQIASAKVLVIFHFHHNKSFLLFVRFMDITSYLLHIREFLAGGRDLHWKTHVHVLNLWFQLSTWILQIQEEPNLLLLGHRKTLLEILLVCVPSCLYYQNKATEIQHPKIRGNICL